MKIIPKKSLLDSKALATTSGAVDALPEHYDSEGEKISSVDIGDTTKGAVTEADYATIHSSNQETVYPPSRKRKRNQDNENLEGRYMYRLGQEEAKENAERLKKKLKQQGEQIDFTSIQDEASISDITMTRNSKITSPSQAPQHEALTPSAGELELDKASRTVFLANVSSTAIKSKSERKKLIERLESFASEKGVMYKIESLRFRSTAFASSELPKKAAFVKKELMDSTTKTTNAYAVYTTQAAAREAVKQLNGSVILDRHLRVDGIAHPAKIDHRRCVFVGNLSFVDDESEINSTRDDDKNRRQRKGREPGDAEEGLWRQFDKAGKVESVRVIRDKTTRVGKGFAYVQFQVPISLFVEYSSSSLTLNVFRMRME